MITREQLVRIAREAVAGNNRPPASCTATHTEPWGETKTLEVECEHSVRNPAAYDPPEWVLEAMQRAYERGDRDGYRLGAAQSALYPEGG